jgi:ribosomal protein S18 acetylase RimI-like enzyme
MGDAMKIRDVQKTDVRAIKSLAQELAAFHAEKSLLQNDVLNNVLTHYKKLGLVFKVAEHNGKIVGYVLAGWEAGLTRNKLKLHVSNIVVSKRARRQGVGRALLAAMARVTLKYQGNLLSLDVRCDNKDSQAFYKSCGFTLRRRHSKNLMRLQIEGDALKELVRQI